MNLFERKAELVKKTQKKGCVLIAAHRGTFTGNFVHNTINAYFAAIKMGANIIECDVSRSTDGHLFVFHDGGELTSFGIKRNIKRLAWKQVEKLRYFNSIGSRTNQKVQTFEEVLAALKGDILINVDRGWEYWEQIIESVERHKMADQIILKSPVKHDVLSSLEKTGSNYMYVPIVTSKDDIDRALSYDLNFLGIEIVFQSADQDFVAPEYLQQLKDRGLLLWGNAIKLNHKDVLASTFDDDISILSNPDKGWGRLLSMGFNIIQTDWPSLFKDYLITCGYHTPE